MARGQPRVRARCRRQSSSGEGAIDVEGAAVAHQVGAGSCELVGYGLDRDDLVALAAFAVIPTPHCRAVTQREVRRLDPRPRQISIAALVVAAALLLAVGDPLAFDQTAIRDIVADAGEAMDVSGRQGNRQSKDETDTWH